MTFDSLYFRMFCISYDNDMSSVCTFLCGRGNGAGGGARTDSGMSKESGNAPVFFHDGDCGRLCIHDASGRYAGVKKVPNGTFFIVLSKVLCYNKMI